MYLRTINLSILIIISILIPVFSQDQVEDQEEYLSRQKRLLLFPTATVWQVSSIKLFLRNIPRHPFQLSMCVISAISKINTHNVAINAGFNINYNLPFSLANFLTTSYWAKSLTSGTSPIDLFFNKLVESGDDFALGMAADGVPTEVPAPELSINGTDVENETSERILDDNEETTTETETTTKRLKKKRKSKMKRDVTAAEFYAGIKDTMSM